MTAPQDQASSVTERPSIGDMLSEISADFTTLMRQEVELAKAEVQESAKRAGKGAGMLAGAGVAGHMTLLFASLALWWAIGDETGYGWSAYRELPVGWRSLGTRGEKQVCLDFIRENWTDMRPRSLRERMAASH